MINQYFWVKGWYIPLIFFSADDEGRTELPTEQKKQKARSEGKVLKSNEINSAVSLLLLFTFFFIMLSYFSLDLIFVFREQASKLPEVMKMSIYSIGFTYIRSISGYISLFFFSSLVVNIFINIVQVGFLITLKPLEPRWDKISFNFGKWTKKSFASAEAFLTLFKSLLKIAIISLIYLFIIKNNVGKIARLSEYSLQSGISIILLLAYRLCFFSVMFLAVIGLIDYFFQRNQYIENLKMTKEELKQERKEIEGDSLLRSRMKDRMRTILSTNLRLVVPDSDMVITNPEHFAVAIKWDSSKMMAPRVLAKGQDEIAITIRQIAIANNIPLIENKSLARDLYVNVDINDEIPREYWEIVSKILVKVYSMAKKFS